MKYAEYISSQAWQKKRLERLQFDNFQCVVCKGGDHLSVHHLHYETLGREDIQFDLVTVCIKCHTLFDTIERYNRYQKRVHITDNIDQVILERANIYGMANSKVSIELSMSNDFSQWTNRRPDEQIRKSLETDYIEAPKDRGRL